MCFVDYKKAFDRDTTSIENLHYKQSAKVKIDNKYLENIELKSGVGQGCILSPLLFHVYSDTIMKKILYNKTADVMINSIPINNKCNADDTVLLAETAEVLLEEWFKKYMKKVSVPD